MNAFKQLSLWMQLALLALLFLAAMLLVNSLFRGVRVDLTQNNLYTMTDGTKRILNNLDEPINLYFFYSDREMADVTDLRAYADRVREMLEEFESRAKGKIKLQVIDPVPFSEQEDQAKQFGLQSAFLPNAARNVYLGLAATNSVGDEKIIPFFEPGQDKEAFLEYDLAKLIYGLNQTKKPVLGVLSGLPLDGVSVQAAMTPGAPTEAWVVYEQLEQLYTLSHLSKSLDGVNRIDDTIDALWVVHPKSLPQNTLIALDQYVLSGKPIMVFVDPFADADQEGVDPSNPLAAMALDKSSSLNSLFSAWGFEVPSNKALLDEGYGLRINWQGRELRHLGLLGLPEAAFAEDDVATQGLSSVNMGSVGIIKTLEDSKVVMTSLVQSSTDAMLVDTDKFKFLSDPATLQNDFAASGERYTVAARIQGAVPTAFPDEASNDDTHLTLSNGSINIVLVADTDVLSDRMWAQKRRSPFGGVVAQAFAHNGTLVTNIVDNMIGSRDLIGARGRQTFRRPFTRVEALRADAEASFRDTEERLKAELAETENKINELQSSRNDSDNLFVMTDEQQQAILSFQEKQNAIRKDLRKVQHNLNKDIDKLGGWLKFINIALVPFLLIVFAILRLAKRSRRRTTNEVQA